jgi:dihydroflavonol-4-reductase
VGSHIARLLHQQGHTVRILHRANSKMDALQGIPFESAIGDVTDAEAVKQAVEGCDVVYHVAAVADYWRSDVKQMYRVNVDGTYQVMQAAKAAGVKRVVFTSSAAAVGFIEDRPADEKDRFNQKPDLFPYGYSKCKAEEVVDEAVAKGLDVVILNPTVIIGPGDLNMISGTFILQTARYQWLTPYTSGGVAVTDVRDVARWHLLAAEKGRMGERYILSSENYSYKEWFKLIAESIGVTKPRIYVPNFVLPVAVRAVSLLHRLRVNMPLDENQVRLGSKRVYFNAAKAWKELGAPQIDMRQSIRETFAWYESHGFIPDDIFAGLRQGFSRGMKRIRLMRRNAS